MREAGDLFCFPNVCVSVCVCTYRSRRTWGRERSSRAGAAGTCQVWRRAGLPRYCSPFPQPATRLSDSSPARRSGRQRGGGEKETRGWEWRTVDDHQQPVSTLTPFSLRVFSYLRGEVVLLELPSLPEVPAADGVVQPSRPQFGAVVGDVDAARPVCVALELPAERRRTRAQPPHSKNIWHTVVEASNWNTSSPIFAQVSYFLQNSPAH